MLGQKQHPQLKLLEKQTEVWLRKINKCGVA